MTLPCNGLFKLAEECGEVVQAVAKILPYGTNLKDNKRKGLEVKMRHLEDEIGDLLCAINEVIANLNLNTSKIQKRVDMKARRFKTWMPPK